MNRLQVAGLFILLGLLGLFGAGIYIAIILGGVVGGVVSTSIVVLVMGMLLANLVYNK